MSADEDGSPLVPRATYRLQFGRRFTFRDATRIVGYLDGLGVSHVYASPYLRARPGSAHGYDITDHNALNPEIGGEAAFDAFHAALDARGMCQILDFVPNHMGVAQSDNGWWLDVLEWGRGSPHAETFDIDWEPARAELRGKVLLPVLGDHYGTVLEAGELVLRFDPDVGAFSVWYHEHRFPIAPRSYAMLLGSTLTDLRARLSETHPICARLETVVTDFRGFRTAGLSRRRLPGLRKRAEQLKLDLAGFYREESDLAEAIELTIERFNGRPGEPSTFRSLHRLLEVQAYRIAYWRVAADDINYRRFFDINDLAGIRMERRQVFDATHGLVLRLLREGRIHGLRIDHIDGLYDPRQYCTWLRSGVGPSAAEGGFYLVVEKILAHHENLRSDLDVDGTSGYEFLNLVNGLFVDPAGEKPMRRLYRQFSGAEQDFDAVLGACKRLIMETALAGELRVLANRLSRIAQSNWRTRDYTISTLWEALREIVLHFPVYRTYVTARGISPEDRRDIDWAVGQARKRSNLPDPDVFDFVHGVLTTDLVRPRRSGFRRRDVVDLAMRFQQYTGPVMAKAMEDTGFYRYVPLLSLNEVGGDPRRFATSVSAFHRLNQERAKLWPRGMLCTSTHDTKRGEDVRARINVLSEIPEEWGRLVRRWSRLNRSRRHRTDDGPAPSSNDEYLIYQTLLGSWPVEFLDEGDPSEEEFAAYVARLHAYLTKAMREAKLHSSWSLPNLPYESGVERFVSAILDTAHTNPFLASFVPFVRRVALAGMVNSLAQTVLKLTVPGVPDIYQGTELWDLSLVDPDNRRPVDFAHRVGLLEVVESFLEDGGEGDPRRFGDLLDSWPDGRIKLLVVAGILRVRQRYPQVFEGGDYAPLAVDGERAENVCAFLRTAPDCTLLVIVPRLMGGWTSTEGRPPLGQSVWTDTRIILPDAVAARGFSNVLTGMALPPAATGAGGEPGSIAVADALAELPVAVAVSCR